MRSGEAGATLERSTDAAAASMIETTLSYGRGRSGRLARAAAGLG